MLLLGYKLHWVEKYKKIKRRIYYLELELRTRRLRPRPRTQKKYNAKTKDGLFEDRPFQGQGQEWSRPRTKNAIFLDYGR